MIKFKFREGKKALDESSHNTLIGIAIGVSTLVSLNILQNYGNWWLAILMFFFSLLLPIIFNILRRFGFTLIGREVK